MIWKALLLAGVWAATPPKYEDVAPWLFRPLNRKLAGQHVRVREVVGRVGTAKWSPQLSLKKFRKKDWLLITSRRGWSDCFYLVSVYDHDLLTQAHRLEPGDKCTVYGQVVGVPTRVSGKACVVVAKIEESWPGKRDPKIEAKAKFIKEVEP